MAKNGSFQKIEIFEFFLNIEQKNHFLFNNFIFRRKSSFRTLNHDLGRFKKVIDPYLTQKQPKLQYHKIIEFYVLIPGNPDFAILAGPGKSQDESKRAENLFAKRSTRKQLPKKFQLIWLLEDRRVHFGDDDLRRRGRWFSLKV